MDPDETAADVVTLLRVKADEKGVDLKWELESSAPAVIVTDALRVRQILMNVVSNAVKFTSAGTVKLRSFGTQENSTVQMLHYEVTDTGIGISAQDRERVFEAFVQADGTLVRKFGGTGLGLALSRQLARSLGGGVSLTASREGQGSTFLISIPDQPTRRTDQERPSEMNTPYELSENLLVGVRVLVVDDSADNRELIWRFLKEYGALVDFAENGIEGYRKALAAEFDVVLMDIQMPEMDGYTAIQKLREAGYRKPVIALTAHAMSDVRQKCLSVGYTDHLPKPIKPNDLISAVAKYSNKKHSPVANP